LELRVPTNVRHGARFRPFKTFFNCAHDVLCFSRMRCLSLAVVPPRVKYEAWNIMTQDGSNTAQYCAVGFAHAE